MLKKDSLEFEPGGIGCVVSKISLSKNDKNASDIDIKIPSQCDDIGWVCEIKDRAFNRHDGKKVKTVTIPDSVYSIGEKAFMGCEALTEIKMEKYGLVSIGEKAFSGCVTLEDITIPQSVDCIGKDAFDGCLKLKEVYIYDVAKWCGIKFYNVKSNPLSCNGGELVRIDNNGEESSLTDLVIPDEVIAISTLAFVNCESLHAVEMSKSSKCERIGREAFSGCTNLKKLTIPQSLWSVGSDAFKGCKGVSVYGRNLAAWCDINFGNRQANPLSCGGELYMTNSSGDNDTWNAITDLEISGEIKNISDFAFVNYSFIKSVTISADSQCVGIGEDAFRDCSSLEDVKFLGKLNYIKMDAFNGCEKLKKVYIKDIGAWCTIDFGNKSANPINNGAQMFVNEDAAPIDILKIPEGVLFIGKYAFVNCKMLKGLDMTDSYECREIEDSAFEGCVNLTDVKMARYGIKNIRANAFSGCVSLKEMTVPESVVEIWDDAFAGCHRLSKVIIYDIASWCSIEFSNQRSNPLINARKLYLSENNDIRVLNDLTVPEEISFIGRYAFYNCQSLTSICMEPECILQEVREEAFRGCSNLAEITISENVVQIGKSAFSSCTKLNKIHYNAKMLSDFTLDNNVFYDAGKCGEGITVMIGKEVSEIPAYLFFSDSKGNHAPKIKNIVFEKDYKCSKIGDYAFASCRELESVVIPYNADKANKGMPAIDIGEHAFLGCDSIRKIYFLGTSDMWNESLNLDPITKCSEVYFYSDNQSTNGVLCWHYDEYGMPQPWKQSESNSLPEQSRVAEDGGKPSEAQKQDDTLKNVPDEKTEGELSRRTNTSGDECTITGLGTYSGENLSIVSEYHGETVVGIGGDAFKGCKGLKSIEIPSSVTSIGQNAFADCSFLKNVTLMDGLRYIGKYAFKNCKALESITIPNSVSDMEGWAFVGCTLLKSVNLSSDLASLEFNVFQGCTSLTTVTFFPNSNMKKVGWSAFDGCSSLKHINLPQGLTDISRKAFSGCKALSKIYIPKTVRNIEDGAFSGCASLKQIDIPQGVTKICKETFYGCNRLTDVVIPRSVTNIDVAFTECDSLLNVYYGGTYDEWEKVKKNGCDVRLTKATKYLYSEIRPTEPGNFWYYDENSNPVVWKI